MPTFGFAHEAEVPKVDVLRYSSAFRPMEGGVAEGVSVDEADVVGDEATVEVADAEGAGSENVLSNPDTSAATCAGDSAKL